MTRVECNSVCFHSRSQENSGWMELQEAILVQTSSLQEPSSGLRYPDLILCSTTHFLFDLRSPIYTAAVYLGRLQSRKKRCCAIMTLIFEKCGLKYSHQTSKY